MVWPLIALHCSPDRCCHHEYVPLYALAASHYRFVVSLFVHHLTSVKYDMHALPASNGASSTWWISAKQQRQLLPSSTSDGTHVLPNGYSSVVVCPTLI